MDSYTVPNKSPEPSVFQVHSYDNLLKHQPGCGNIQNHPKKWRYLVGADGVKFAAPRWDIMTVTVRWDDWKRDSTVVMYTWDGQFGRIKYKDMPASEQKNVSFLLGPKTLDKVAVHLPSIENNIIQIP